EALLQKIMDSREFRWRMFLSKLAFLTASGLFLLAIGFFAWSLSVDFWAAPTTTAAGGEATLAMTIVRLLAFFSIVVTGGGVGGAFLWHKHWARRGNLLRDLAQMDPSRKKEIYDYLRSIVRPPTSMEEDDNLAPTVSTDRRLPWLYPQRQSLEWLRGQMEEELGKARGEKRLARLGSKIGEHL
ncbi:MAG: hypothetical protein MN733_06940, partial [Nitrososphaera sp.]|nr:hypothetical protein [Nitrososphaera sp.]